MSNNANTNLMEQIAEFIDSLQFEDTEFEYLANQAIKDNDLEQLQWLLNTYCELCGQQVSANCNNANCTYQG